MVTSRLSAYAAKSSLVADRFSGTRRSLGMVLHDAELDGAVLGSQLVLVGDCRKDKARQVI